MDGHKNPSSRSSELNGVVPSQTSIGTTPELARSAIYEPTLAPSVDKRAEILLWLLRENRSDIRFWQERLFFASFWLDAAIVGIVAFALREELNIGERVVLAIGCVCLAIFHSLIANVAKRSIELNGSGLLRLQAGLLLNAVGQYLSDEPIYSPTGKWLDQKYITSLIALNILLCAGALLVMLLTSVRLSN